MFERRPTPSVFPLSRLSKRLGLLLLPLVGLGLTACGPQDSQESKPEVTQETTGTDGSESSETTQLLQTGGDWSCPSEPGQAPSGELVAERIPGSESQRDEPGLYEGPVWIDGALYFSDFTFVEGFPSRIQRLTPEGEMETVIRDSGSNGLAVDSEGYIMAATHDLKAISRYNRETGERELIWEEYAGEPFNSPNDLTLTRDGRIYFTDPDFQRTAAPGGQPETRVYHLGDEGIEVVESGIINPNGVALSPDEQTLYVAGGEEEGVLRAYDLNEQGMPSGHRDLASLSIPDGMAIDCLGNIYTTEHAAQRARVFSPEGEQLAEIRVDANITNAAFGGPERKTLYLTGQGTVWRLELDVAGYPY